MEKKFRIAIIILFILYSIFLIFLECYKSQGYVRNFFSDINNPVSNIPFYGINTTICVFLIWASALLFLISALITDRFRKRKFYFSQVIIFFFLGFDDRFQIHEMIGDFLEIEDAFVLLICWDYRSIIINFLGRYTKNSYKTKNEIDHCRYLLLWNVLSRCFCAFRNDPKIVY